MQITSADAYVGKSFKYLAIFDRALKKHVVPVRLDGDVLTVEYLVDVLTPNSAEEIPTNIVSRQLSDEMLRIIIDNAKARFVILVNVLAANYWSDLTKTILGRKKWDPISLIAEFLSAGDRRSIVIYNALVELYVQLTILRTAGDNVDLSIHYEEVVSW